MPRRSPGEIRAQLPLRRRLRRRPPVIRGLSPSANGQIALFERRRGLPPGEVAHAFRRWSDTARRGGGNVELFYACEDADFHHDSYHVRTLLEAALHALRTRARRELRTAIDPVDERVLRRTLNNPSAHPDLPWWMRRIGV
ncbi:hypothetical protein ACSMX9_09960 [Streptomyces sp. LE64]|uniref:hypothetical protein n=1 Tax=Streptomyces sp. LE64 TaxID=3448653 RepID=UPI0040433922